MIRFTADVPAPTMANPAAACIGTQETTVAKVPVTIVITAETALMIFLSRHISRRSELIYFSVLIARA